MPENIRWLAIFPEIVLLVMACVVALVDLRVTSKSRAGTHMLAMISLAVVALLHGTAARFSAGFPPSYIWAEMVLGFDVLGSWLKCFATLAVMVTLTYGHRYAQDRGMLRGGELFSLSMLALLGISVLISANHFLLLYLGLELLTLSSYALVALRRDHKLATEAAMKYFVLGAMASGFLLYGLSMLYGATGSLDIQQVLKVVQSGEANQQVLIFGLVFVVAGIAFKLGVVPFHMWIPDVYQGAPTAVTLMIGSAPKFAAFALAFRLLVDGLLPLAADWQQMLGLLAIGSLLVGNLAAIMQTNLKRMLAYSTISQMGFVLLGLMSGALDGHLGDYVAAKTAYGAAMFYVVTYVLTTLAAFGVMLLLAREGFESEEIADFAGLNQRNPLYAAIMGVCLFSMAGIPPLVGFYAKLAVLQALVAAGGVLHVALAIFAVMMSLIGAFYYLRVVKVMYFDAPGTATGSVAVSLEVRTLLVANGALVLLLGLMPGGLMELCSKAILQALTA